MQNRVTYKTSDGTLREQLFDDFNEFADLMQDAAIDFYTGQNPEMSVESIYSDMIKKEKVTNNEQPPRPELLD